jgi:hypothetical protein
LSWCRIATVTITIITTITTTTIEFGREPMATAKQDLAVLFSFVATILCAWSGMGFD